MFKEHTNTHTHQLTDRCCGHRSRLAGFLWCCWWRFDTDNDPKSWREECRLQGHDPPPAFCTVDPDQDPGCELDVKPPSGSGCCSPSKLTVYGQAPLDSLGDTHADSITMFSYQLFFCVRSVCVYAPIRKMSPGLMETLVPRRDAIRTLCLFRSGCRTGVPLLPAADCGASDKFAPNIILQTFWGSNCCQPTIFPPHFTKEIHLQQCYTPEGPAPRFGNHYLIQTLNN